MKKPHFVPFAVALLLASTVVLVSAAELLSKPMAAIPSPRSISVVRAYYAAVEYFLETGDLGPVRSIVAPELLDHRHLDTLGEELESYLMALRQTYPELQMHVDNLEDAKDSVTAQVRIETGRHQTFAGIRPVNQLQSWLLTETFLIEGDRIVNRSSTGFGHGLFLANPGLPVSLPLASESRAMAVRLTLDAHSENFVFISALAVLIPERGQIRILGNGDTTIVRKGEIAGERTEPSKMALAGWGDTIVISGSRVAIGGAGVQASVLALLFVPTLEVTQFRDRQAEPDPLFEALKRPAGGAIGDGITITPIHRATQPIDGESTTVTAGWAVLENGGAIVIQDTGHPAVVVPIKGTPIIEQETGSRRLAIRNLESDQALAWVATIS